MQTDDLIRLLATGLEPVPVAAARRRWALALAGALPVVTAMMLVTLGVQPGLGALFARPMFWMKLAFPAAVAAAAIVGCARLARPGAQLGRVPSALALPFAVIVLVALVALAQTAPEARIDAWLGATWRKCPALIAMLSTPTFVAALWALRGLAPTRLRLAGACAGLLAGAVGAFVYAFHCPELTAPFIATWYVLGMLAPAAVGALLGPALLRW